MIRNNPLYLTYYVFEYMAKFKYNFFLFILFANLLAVIYFNITGFDLDISHYDFIGDTQNSYTGGPDGGGNSSAGGGNSSGGGPGHERQHAYYTESNTDKDSNEPSSSNQGSRRARLLEKPSDTVEINTVEDALNHLEKLKQREINLRYLIAQGRHYDISRDIRLRDLDISFKKPLSPIAKYLDNCRKMDDPRCRIFHKSSPGNTPINSILNYLRNKL